MNSKTIIPLNILWLSLNRLSTKNKSLQEVAMKNCDSGCSAISTGDINQYCTYCVHVKQETNIDTTKTVWIIFREIQHQELVVAQLRSTMGYRQKSFDVYIVDLFFHILFIPG